MAVNVSADELDYVQIDRKLVARAVKALDRAKSAGLKVVTAESCTGGLITTVLSEAPGAAEYLQGGFVTYTPQQKCAALKLDAKPGLLRLRAQGGEMCRLEAGIRRNRTLAHPLRGCFGSA